MAQVIGIDLGTTNSVMAHLKYNKPETIENIDSNRLTPSVVGLDMDGKLVVGEIAKNQALLYPERTIYSIKRFMGRQFRDPDIQRDIEMAPYKVTEAENGEVVVWLDGKSYTPQQISAEILKAMKQEAEAQLGDTVDTAVITVPAYFNTRQKYATREAGRLAGLKVMAVLAEPAAAAMAYGLDNLSGGTQIVAVYDLGGGTFDATVLCIANGSFTDLAKRGNNHLGGDDFDQKIMEHILGLVRKEHGMDLSKDNYAKQKIKAAAEKAKIQLSKREKVPIAIAGLFKKNNMMIDIQMTLTRKQYEDMIEKMVDDSIKILDQTIHEDADLTDDQLDKVLCVGGPTMTPLVLDKLKDRYGEEKVVRMNAMEVVAHGAAIQTAVPVQTTCPNCQALNDPWEEKCVRCGHQLIEAGGEVWKITCSHCGHENPRGRTHCENCEEPLVIIEPPIQKTALPIGIMTEGDLFSEVIIKGTIYPMEKPERKLYRTSKQDMVKIDILVYEGEKTTASENSALGKLVLKLEPGKPENSPVEIAMSLDHDSILTVKAYNPENPDEVVEARLDMEAPPTVDIVPNHQDVPEPASQPTDQVQTILMMASMVRDLGGELLTYTERNRLVSLITDLEAAIQSANKQRISQKTEALELYVMNNLQDVLTVCFGMILVANKDSTLITEEERKLLATAIAKYMMCVQEKKDRKSPQCVILYIQIQVQVGAILSRIQGSSGQVSGGEAPAPANILDLLRGDTRS